MPECKIAILLGLSLILGARLSSAQQSGLDKQAAEVKADRLEVEHKLGRARFLGNVRAMWTNLTISCDEMTVSYDKNGGIVSLTASGKVLVEREDAAARAASARLDVRRDTLILEGNPILTKGSNQIQGERIEIDLKSGRLDVSKAKGKFKIGRKGG